MLLLEGVDRFQTQCTFSNFHQESQAREWDDEIVSEVTYEAAPHSCGGAREEVLFGSHGN